MNTQTWIVDNARTTIRFTMHRRMVHFALRNPVDHAVGGGFVPCRTRIQVDGDDVSRLRGEVIVAGTTVELGRPAPDLHPSAAFFSAASFPSMRLRLEPPGQQAAAHAPAFTRDEPEAKLDIFALPIAGANLVAEAPSTERVSVVAKGTFSVGAIGLHLRGNEEGGGVTLDEHVELEVRIEATRASRVHTAEGSP
jgi:hypothetical protein